jgi:hypothetical protein
VSIFPVCINTGMYKFQYVYISVCIYISMYIYQYVYISGMYVGLSLCVCVCVSVCVCLCVCVCVCECACRMGVCVEWGVVCLMVMRSMQHGDRGQVLDGHAQAARQQRHRHAAALACHCMVHANVYDTPVTYRLQITRHLRPRVTYSNMRGMQKL